MSDSHSITVLVTTSKAVKTIAENDAAYDHIVGLDEYRFLPIEDGTVQSISVHIEASAIEAESGKAKHLILSALANHKVTVLKILNVPTRQPMEKPVHARMWLRDTFDGGRQRVTVIGMNPSTAEHLQSGTGAHGDQTAGKLRKTFEGHCDGLTIVNLVPVFMTDSKKTDSVWQQVTPEFQQLLGEMSQLILKSLLKDSMLVIPMWGTLEGPLNRWKRPFAEQALEIIHGEQQRRTDSLQKLQVKALPVDGGYSATHSYSWPPDAYSQGLLKDVKVVAKTVHFIEFDD